MALSNWDTFSIDHNNKSCNGVFVSKTVPGVSVEIYKNWLYLRDKKSWRKKTAYIKPTIMEINSCSLNYMGIHIYAKRGPKYGVYCIIEEHDYNSKTKRVFNYNAMIGIGCEGYKDPVYEYFKEKNQLDKYESGGWHSGSGNCNENHEWVHFIENCETKEYIELTEEQYEEYSAWVGVEQEELDFLQEMLDEKIKNYEVDKRMEKINLSKGERFNQGNAFFSKALTGKNIVNQKIGEKDVIIATELIKGVTK